jgi:glycosyltransferase involved in cell wall biosynthesis
MTLTILATNPNPDLYGASRMLLESVRGFRAEGWQVTVTIPSATGPLVDQLEAVGAEVRTCPTPALRRGDLSPLGLLRLAWHTFRSIPPGIRLLRQVRPDVVYVTTLIQPLWLVLGRVLRIRVVCHVHESESTAPKLLRRLLALPLLLAHQVVFNSRFSQSVQVAAMPRLARRCEVVHNGVAGPSTVTPPRGSLDGSVRLLYVGRLSERKGVLDAVDAIVELDRLGTPSTLDIVGDVFPGYEWVVDDLQARVRAGGIDERVHLHGFAADIWPFLAAADVLLVPARVDESFGNTAVEGVLAARPVIATRTGGLPEALEGMTSARLVPASNPAAIAAAVAELAAGWPEVRRAVTADAARAAVQFAPGGYQAAMARAVAQIRRET